MVLEHGLSPSQGMESGSRLKLRTKVTLRWIKGIHLRAKTVKLLEENQGKLCGVGFGNDFLGVTPVVQVTGVKVKGT